MKIEPAVQFLQSTQLNSTFANQIREGLNQVDVTGVTHQMNYRMRGSTVIYPDCAHILQRYTIGENVSLLKEKGLITDADYKDIREKCGGLTDLAEAFIENENQHELGEYNRCSFYNFRDSVYVEGDTRTGLDFRNSLTEENTATPVRFISVYLAPSINSDLLDDVTDTLESSYRHNRELGSDINPSAVILGVTPNNPLLTGAFGYCELSSNRLKANLHGLLFNTLTGHFTQRQKNG